jgi:hypothetical protein
VTLTTSRTRFVVACVVGAIAACVVFGWMVFAGSTDLLQAEPLGAIYDAQARSLLHGHWEVPKDVLSFERFNVDGRYHTYFGPWPAVLRMPVIALTDAYDGRLSRVSMLVAFIVLVAFAARLAWQARVILRGRGPVGWRTLLAAAGFVFVVGCGSTALFLGSRAFVYHEAILWAVAWSVAGYSFLVAYLVDGRRRDLVGTCVTATLALLSRPSVGLGPALALGALLAVRILEHVAIWWRARSQRPSSGPLWVTRALGVNEARARGSVWTAAAAVVVPIALYAYVNSVKFGSLFGVPIDKQDVLLRRPERRASLAATGNTLFGIDYAPTNLLQYFRPDAIGFRRTFPWVTFADAPHVFGNVIFDNIEPSASLTVTSILLVALAVLGVAAAVRSARARRREPATENDSPSPTAAVFRIALLTAALTTASTIAIAVLFERYEGDFVPFLTVGAAVGLFWLPVLLAGRRVATRIIAIALIVLGAWSVYATFSLALVYQREYSAFQAPSVRASFVDFQLDANESLGIDLPSVSRGDELPVIPNREINRTDAPHGQLFVVGDCDALYLASGRSWEPIEEPLPGEERWRVRFDASSPGTRQPLWSADGGSQILWANWLDDDTVRLEHEWTGAPYQVAPSDRTWDVEVGRSYDLDVRLDPTVPYIEVRHEDDLLYSGFPLSFQSAERPELGRQGDARRGATRLNGSVRPMSVTPICDRLTRSDD